MQFDLFNVTSLQQEPVMTNRLCVEISNDIVQPKKFCDFPGSLKWR